MKGGKSDYIHANYVNTVSGDPRYILTQAPKKETVEDFWAMIYEQKALAVVSLVTDHEMANNALVEYVPGEGKTTKFGNLEVTCAHCQDDLFHDVRKVVVKSQTIGEERSLVTIRVRDWEDQMCPTHPCVIQPTVDRIQNLLRDTTQEDGPVVIHCKAGVSRSASIMAISNLSLHMEREGRMECNPSAYVAYARQFRHSFNSLPEPFIFMHRALQNIIQGHKFKMSTWNSIVCGNIAGLSAEDLEKLYRYVSVTDPELSEGDDIKQSKIRNGAPHSSRQFAITTLLTKKQNNGNYINASWIPVIKIELNRV